MENHKYLEAIGFLQANMTHLPAAPSTAAAPAAAPAGSTHCRSPAAPRRRIPAGPPAGPTAAGWPTAAPAAAVRWRCQAGRRGLGCFA